MFRRSSTRFALAALGATAVAVTVAAQGVPPGLVTSQELAGGASGRRLTLGDVRRQLYKPAT